MDLVQQFLLLRQRQPPPQLHQHTNPLALLRQASVQRRGEEGEAVREPRPSTSGTAADDAPAGAGSEVATAGGFSADAALAAMAAGRRQPGTGRQQQQRADELLSVDEPGGVPRGFASAFTNPLALEASEELAGAGNPPPQPPAATQPARVDAPAPATSSRAVAGASPGAAASPEHGLAERPAHRPPAAGGAAGLSTAGAAAQGDALDSLAALAAPWGAGSAAHGRQQGRPPKPSPAAPAHTAMPWDTLSRFEGRLEAAAEAEAAHPASSVRGARPHQAPAPALARPSPGRLLAAGEEGASAVSLSHHPRASSPTSEPSGSDAEDDALATRAAGTPGGSGSSSALSTLLGALHERGYAGERRALDQQLAGTAAPQQRRADGRSPPA